VRKPIKQLILFTLALVIAAGFGGAGIAVAGGTPQTLRVYNAAEYIDRTILADFEKAFGVQVIYEEFDSNEEMYDRIARDPKAFDVLIPSDYAIDRLIQEGLLEKIDPAKIPNMAFIAPEYLNPAYDPANEYVVPYMVGTLGILYNKRMVPVPVDSWAALWDTQYRGRIWMWDSMRDVVGLALKMHGFSVNSNDDAELAQAKASLLSQRQLVRYESELIRDSMIADEGTLALVYSGDAKTAVDQNPNLAYVIPREGSNKWVDGFVIVKGTERLEAAHNFINFMCSPHIAIRNMTATGYTSPVFIVWEEFASNPIMFPSAEELARCEPFMYNKEATQKYMGIWSEVR